MPKSVNTYINPSYLRKYNTADLAKVLEPMKTALEENNLWIDTGKKGFPIAELAIYLQANEICYEVERALYTIKELSRARIEPEVWDVLETLGENAWGKDNVERAVLLWELSPDLCVRIISKYECFRQRNYKCFIPQRPLRERISIETSIIASLEANLTEKLSKTDRGKYIQIIPHQDGAWAYMSISHATRKIRESTVEEDKPTSKVWRKEVGNIFRINTINGELELNLNDKGKRFEATYLECIAEAFIPNNKFVPLAKFDLRALALHDITRAGYENEILAVTVKKVKFSSKGLSYTVRGNDVLKKMDTVLRSGADFKGVEFSMLFSGDSEIKTVFIDSTNRISFPEKCDHELITAFLRLNGIVREGESISENVDTERNTLFSV